MVSQRRNRGSALLISLVIVVLVAGIGGAFLVDSLSHSKRHSQGVDMDEAMTMCDAGMERARQALDFYRGYQNTGTKWTWDQILTYCSARPSDANVIKNDYLDNLQSALYTNYQSRIWSNSTSSVGANNRFASATIPPNPTTPAPTDPTDNFVFVGWNVPFHKGAIHVHVSNNDDSAAGGSPTHDADGQVIIRVTATLPSGIQRQVEGVFKSPDPIALKIAGKGLGAVVSKDTVELLGNVSIDGRDYDMDNNLKSSDIRSAPGILTEKTVDMSRGSAVVGGNNGEGYGEVPPGSVGRGRATTAPPGTVTDSSSRTPPPVLPTTPGEVLGMSDLDLKNIAKANGTYFDGSPGKEYKVPPGGWDGAVVYVDYQPAGGNVDIGDSTYNKNPSVLIFHTDAPAAPVVAKNLKGHFKGLLIADSVSHTSAPSGILGQLQMLSPTSASSGNAFGTANTPIHFSYDTLQNLPKSGAAGNTTQPSTLVSYRRVQ